MTDESARYATIAAGFSQRLDGVRSDQWDAQSPCPDWTARGVVEHVVATHRRILSLLDGSLAEPPTSEDLPAAWREASGNVQATLSDPAKAGHMIPGRFGEMRFEELVGTLLCADTLIHTWDLARATGQDDTLDPEAVETATRFLAARGEAIRVPGGFGPAIEPPPNADAQTTLLCITGRKA